MRRFTPFLAAVAMLGCANLVSAQTTSDPVGFTTSTCPANSDTFLSLPFTRPPEFTGAISSVAGNVITVQGTPFSASQYVYVAGSQPKRYFALIGPHASTNPNEGRTYEITANGTSTLTVNLNGDSISGVAANTQVLVVPYHSLNSVFPASDAGVSYIASPSPGSRQTEILIPDLATSGINLSASATYYYFNGGWRKFGQDPATNFGDDVLCNVSASIRSNTAYFLLRNAGTGTTLTTLGSVLVKKETIPLLTSASAQRDNFVSVIRPIDVKLDDLGLITSGAFVASPSPGSLTDQLFVFDNATAALNKSASATYYYFNGAWRKFGQDPATNFGTDLIKAGTGFVIRKNPAVSGITAFWTNVPTY